MSLWDIIYSRVERQYAKEYDGGKYRAVVVDENGQVSWEFTDMRKSEGWGLMNGGWGESVEDAMDKCDEYFKECF